MWPFKKKAVPLPRFEPASLNPGDTLVIQTDDPPDTVTAQRIAELISKQAGFKVAIMFLPYNAKFSVISATNRVVTEKPAPTPVPSNMDPKAP